MYIRLAVSTNAATTLYDAAARIITDFQIVVGTSYTAQNMHYNWDGYSNLYAPTPGSGPPVPAAWPWTHPTSGAA
jgi:hypothetical protein